ncbi:hypothetical protein CANARDRAFT_25133 [[Candida] arabinofermentans NRRL YB-2248]|uniref:Retrotransposon gag domain-containing protein n=1 Tax=[Candida] arabinofermentans NRRL YB-2248 TaxID=983967 RepID=A0A1E4SV02_9ASCO|nr:hypothetical protein CANARDRAFT_25133 [[Candida] arabinofermentans NRRL YB-2248]
MSQDKEITQFKRLHANVPIFDDPNAGSALAYNRAMTGHFAGLERDGKKLSEQAKIGEFGRWLSGEANNWYWNLLDRYKEVAYEELVSYFALRFHPGDYEMDRREIDTPVEHANIEALRAEIMKIDNMLTKNGVHPGRDVKDRDGDTIMDLSAMSRDQNKFKDTGACGNFISKDFILMDKLEGDLEKAVPITVWATTGKTVMVDEVLQGNVRFAIADVELSDSMMFYVVDN